MSDRRILRLIARFEAMMIWLFTLVPDAHCEGCDPPDVPDWVWRAIDAVSAILERLYALLGAG